MHVDIAGPQPTAFHLSYGLCVVKNADFTHPVHLHTCFPPQSLNNEQTLLSKQTGEREREKRTFEKETKM